jgi:signal peptidase I
MKNNAEKWAAPLLCGFFVFLLFRHVFFIGYVPSESMAPVIKSGSVILGCRITGNLQRGAIVVFRHDGVLLVKRIAGVPGDVVYAGDGLLTVPDGCYYMLGDNESCSIDSRYWEEPFVSREQIIAGVMR